MTETFSAPAYTDISVLAERLQVHPETIRRWIGAGKISGVVRLPGGRIRIPETALAEVLSPFAPSRYDTLDSAADLCRGGQVDRTPLLAREPAEGP